jgi:hypothetical protein
MESKNSLSEKLWIFGESPLTWGAIGILFGAVAVVVSMKWIFVLAGVVFAFAVLRMKFFEGRTFVIQIAGSLGLFCIIAVALLFVWRVVPKPKEAPTVEDIANAVKKKLTENVQAVAGASVPTADQAVKPQPPLTAANRPPKKPNLPSKPKPAQPSAPSSTPPSATLSLQAHLNVTQSQKISTRTDAPVETEVVVQTDNTFPSLKFVMQCNKSLIDAHPTIGGTGGTVQMMVSSGVLREHPNVVVYSYGSSVPLVG